MKLFTSICALLTLFVAACDAQVVQPINNGKLINNLDGNNQDLLNVSQIGMGNATTPTARLHLFPGATPTAASDGIWIGNDVKIYRSGAGALTLDGNVTVTGTITGGGGVVALNGVNIWTGTNTYSGAVTINGNLTLTSGAVTIAGGTAAAMRTALALVPGTNVQAYDADLATIAGFTAGQDNFMVSDSGAWTLKTPAQVKTTLGLGTGSAVTFGAGSFTTLSASGIATFGAAVNTASTITMNGLQMSNVTGTFTIGAPLSITTGLAITDNAAAITLGPDVNLYRSGANQLKTDDDLVAKSITLTGGAGIGVGAGGTGRTSAALNNLLVGAGGASALTQTPATTYTLGLMNSANAAAFLTAIDAAAYNLTGDLAGSTLLAPAVAAGTITSAKIADGTIATADIANSAITTALINNGAVTAAKLETIGGLTPGTYGAATGLSYPVITVDGAGRITGAATQALSNTVLLTSSNAAGDLTGSTFANPTLATGSVTSAKILDGTIIGTDISSSASISVASLTLSGNLLTNGDITLGNASADTLTVSATSAFAAPATFTGNLIAGDPVVGSAPFFVDASTDTIRIGINSSDTLTINAVSDFTSNVSVATNKVTIAAASGNTAIAGTLAIGSDVTVNTDKFTIAAASGNTAVAGTLVVTGATTAAAATFSGTVAAPTINVSTALNVGTSKFSVTGTNGDIVTTGTADITGNAVLRGHATNLLTSGKNIIVAPGAGAATDTRTALTGGTFTISKYDAGRPFDSFSAAYAAAAADDTIVLRPAASSYVINMNAQPVNLVVETGAVISSLIVAPSVSGTMRISGGGVIAVGSLGGASVVTIDAASSVVHLHVPITTSATNASASGYVRVLAGSVYLYSAIQHLNTTTKPNAPLLSVEGASIVHVLSSASVAATNFSSSSSGPALAGSGIATALDVASGATVYVHSQESIRGLITGTLTRVNFLKQFTGHAARFLAGTQDATDATPLDVVWTRQEGANGDGVTLSSTLLSFDFRQPYEVNVSLQLSLTQIDADPDFNFKAQLAINQDNSDNSFVATPLDNVIVYQADPAAPNLITVRGRIRVVTATTAPRIKITLTQGNADALPATLVSGSYIEIRPIE